MVQTIRFTLNGKPAELTTDGDRKLLWLLRTELELTGTKYGCGEGHCGACTVLVNGEATRSCQYPAKYIEGKEVITIEGLALEGELHPLQQAFIEHSALQCGYCTPGMILNAYSLLSSRPEPTEAEILETMEGNLCRCGGYGRIVQAIQSAAQTMRGEGAP